MAILGKPQGIFELDNSDISVGSFLLRHDICEILQVSDSDLSSIKFKNIDGLQIADERIIQKAWYGGNIPNATPSDKSSLDELLLIAIIKKTFPDIKIERQVKVKRYSLDLKLTQNGKTLFVEFDGPSHFAPSRYGNPGDPFKKKRSVEDETGLECVKWPYWIQRCTTNVKALFDSSVNGLGVLWSTEVHFGMFIFENSADIIDTITKRFNAVDGSGYGYFYGSETKERNNPEHPIIEKIRQNKTDIGTLLPRGFADRAYWLPDKLQI
ncbi:MAG: hypothetical protein HY807_00750 [Nitrospirae bacterium]|nr:hypothetical protein [Nitrospirota bacterium]